ncbi:MAG: branched-chain amino acid ABC transporter permease [Kiloniellales bacterium]
MSLSIAGQLLINGLMLGGIYALIALGLSLIYGVVGVANFAQGSFLMVGMYFVWGLTMLAGLEPLLALPFVAVFMFGVGWLFYTRLLDRIIGRPTEVTLFMTMGLALVLDNVFLLTFTADRKFVQTSYDDVTLYLGDIALPLTRLAGFATAVVVAGLLMAFLAGTKLGRTIRAVAQDRELAESLGVDSRRIFAIAVGIGVALAGVAGGLLTSFHPISPEVGLRYLLIAFIVVVVGGMGSMIGSIVAALLVGLLYSIGYQLFGGEGGLILAYLVLLGILNFRPGGLLGDKLSST